MHGAGRPVHVPFVQVFEFVYFMLHFNFSYASSLKFSWFYYILLYKTNVLNLKN